MGWPHIAAFTLAGMGAIGFVLMSVAFVLIARQGGWKAAIQDPSAAGRWPMSRRLLFAGAVLGALFGVGIVVLTNIPGGVPWRN